MGILFHACFDLRQPHCFPIALWQMDGETMETVTDFIFLGSKITADGDCSHPVRHHSRLPHSRSLLLPGRER